jgi:hypothetical protein
MAKTPKQKRKAAIDKREELRDKLKGKSKAVKARLRTRMLAQGEKAREQGDILRGISGRERGEGTRYYGPTGGTMDLDSPEAIAARKLRDLPDPTKYQLVNEALRNELGDDLTIDQWRNLWGKTGSTKYKEMQQKQADKYEEMFGEKLPDDDGTTDDGTTGDYDDYIGPGDAEGGYPFPGMELGVGFPKESKGYLRSFPSAPEYGGDVEAKSLLDYTPEWAGRDSSAWGVLDPRAYGPPQQVMPWMGPLGQAPLRYVKGKTDYVRVDDPTYNQPAGSGSRVGNRDWVSGGRIIPPIGTTAWKPTPYSAAEIANWQRFNQGLLAPSISFGGQTADQLAQFGLGSSGLLDTNLMKAGKQTA